ncbi:MAG: DUF951 domain-containing protein [Oscillospiraceae bacterium]
MDVDVGDSIVLKKNHPCGNNVFKVTRVGVDFKLICTKCNHDIMVPRIKIIKKIKKIIKQ